MSLASMLNSSKYSGQLLFRCQEWKLSVINTGPKNLSLTNLSLLWKSQDIRESWDFSEFVTLLFGTKVYQSMKEIVSLVYL